MTKIELDPQSVRVFRIRLAEYSKGTGKTIQQSMDMLGKSCAKELAVMVQPYGISAKHGAAFQASIGKQVARAVRAANVAGTPGSADLVHQNVRTKGQVPRGLKTQGQFNRKPITLEDKNQLVNEKQAKAGKAKGAWIAAGEAIDGKKMQGIAKWIRRHAMRNGIAKIKSEGMGSVIYLTNSLSYIDKIQPKSVIDTALKRGYWRAWRHMTITVKKIRKEI
jgi:hypothetical protein